MVAFERFPKYKHNYTDSGWEIDHSPIGHYLEDFAAVDLDNKVGETLTRIKDNKSSVIIDLMATTRAMEDLHSQGFKGRLLAVGIDEDARVGVRESDFYNDIEYRQADLGTSTGWHEVEDLLGEMKVDFVMQRSYGGLHYISTNLSYYRLAMGRVWNMLSSDSGLAVLQTPPRETLLERGIDIEEWVGQLSSSGIYGRFGQLRNSRDEGYDYGMLIVQKATDSQRLPILK